MVEERSRPRAAVQSRPQARGGARGIVVLLACLVLPAWREAQGEVKFSEIMYHPGSGLDEDEFLELHNTGAEPVDLSGWSIDGAGDLALRPGATVAPGGYFVVAKQELRFAEVYGFLPGGTYTGRLSNDGECLTLFTPTGGLADRVCYLDRGEWAVTPDGLGKSLERVAPSYQGNSARNWRASMAPEGQTAGRGNSVHAQEPPPWISAVAFDVTRDGQSFQGDALDAGRVTAADLEQTLGFDLRVTASVEDADEVLLSFRSDFNEEITVPMSDDGRSGDGAANDGVYGASTRAISEVLRPVASLPIRPSSKRSKERAASVEQTAPAGLVRFRITASGPSGVMQHPRDDDTIDYVGTVLEDSDLETALPVFHWFMRSQDYQAALDHRWTDETEPAVFFYNGALYDNVQVRVRGATAREYPKKHWKFRFPQGHDFNAPDLIPRPVDQFNLQGNWSDKSYLREILAYETFAEAGTPSLVAFPVRVQMNGGFHSLCTYLEAMDEDYLDRHDLDENGAWYKAFGTGRINFLPSDYEKKTRLYEDHSDLQEFFAGMHYATGAALTEYVFDNVDVPAMINYLAVQAIIHNGDYGRKNYYLYRDTEGTGRWTMHPWDMDLTFGRNWDGRTVLNDEIRADRPPDQPQDNRVIQQLYADPLFRQMYFRRLRTLMDEFLVSPRYEERMEQLLAVMAPEAEIDRYLEWRWYGWRQSMAQGIWLINNEYLPVRRQTLFSTYRVPGKIPAAQSAAPRMVINEIMYHPAAEDRAGEFVELYNPAPFEEVDVSGWRIEGIGMTLPAGAVVLPGLTLTVVGHDTAFREVHPGRFVAGEFDGDLANNGELLVLCDREGRVVDEVPFEDGAPWPATADGGGFSLERIDADVDGARPAAWAASLIPGGSPGEYNSAAAVLAPVPDLYVSEVLPANESTNSDEAGDFDPWLEIYNASDAPVALGGMWLTDDHNVPQSWRIPPDTSLGPRRRLLVWGDNEPAEGGLHASFAISADGGTVALYDQDGRIIDSLTYDPLPVDVSFGRFPDGALTLREFATPTPAAPNRVTPAPLILNEYNAVRPGDLLENDGEDAHWGRVAGNGGDWFELVVAIDHLDVRGWQLVVSDQTGSPGETVQTLVFSDDEIWSDLRSGTLITVSEELPDDLGYDPAAGDWWINVQAEAAASGTFITAIDFEVSNRDWQVTILEQDETVMFGPAGEGVHPASGIGSDEVLKLEEPPGPAIGTRSNYRDGSSSTFGAPNVFAAGTRTQDFSLLRLDVLPCAADEECDDSNPCTIDACVAQGCRHDDRCVEAFEP